MLQGGKISLGVSSGSRSGEKGIMISVHRVHEHPSYQWWRCAFVEASEAFFPDSLKDAVYWPFELRSL